MIQTPYLSVVATARNDNHGGNMLNRMQIFVNGLLEQSRHYQLPIELVLVEWNPPPDRPRLAEVLSWERQSEFCEIRIIEVPSWLHQRFNHAEVLPLFQMIGKNVGIRRARGEFILATNIDILFSDELFQFLATRSLKRKEMYRADRWDVPPFISAESSLAEQLVFCREKCLRINRKGETVVIEPAKPVLDVPKDTSELTESGTELSAESRRANRWDKIPSTLGPLLGQLRKVYRHLLPKQLKDAVLSLLPQDLRQWLIGRGLLEVQPEPSVQPEPVTILPRYPLLHTNGCGDFTLLAREIWQAVRGYPEFEMHGLHLDAILCHAAYHAGAQEYVLQPNQVVYHIEHGRTWFPHWGSETVASKEEIDKIPKLDDDQVAALATLMNQLHRPILFNPENWGFGEMDLPETTILPQQILL